MKKKSKEFLSEHDLHKLEGHIFGSEMICINCGMSMIDLDYFKNRNSISLITCDMIKFLREKERRKQLWLL